MKTCVHCSNPITGKRLRWEHVKFCSKVCSTAYARKLGPASQYVSLATSTVGAIHELKVACDLMQSGFQVFRALSASCDCDLAVLCGNKLIRVEVTTGYSTRSGRVTYNIHKSENFDVMAVVHKGGILYAPENWKDAYK